MPFCSNTRNNDHCKADRIFPRTVKNARKEKEKLASLNLRLCTISLSSSTPSFSAPMVTKLPDDCGLSSLEEEEEEEAHCQTRFTVFSPRLHVEGKLSTCIFIKRLVRPCWPPPLPLIPPHRRNIRTVAVSRQFSDSSARHTSLNSASVVSHERHTV